MEASPTSRTSRVVLIAALAVAALTAVVYLPVLEHDFLRYDDEVYVYENPHIQTLRWKNVVWMFTHSYFKSYTPLALLSHAIDLRLYGMDPRGHHLTSYVLHILNTVWVFLLALLVLAVVRARVRGGEAAGWRTELGATDLAVAAAGAALLHALHPLRVESVSWISDRKDLLLGFFLFGTITAYLLYLLNRGTRSAMRWYVAAVVLFVLALFSKTAAVTAPVILLCLDTMLVRRAGPVRWKDLLLELAPFIALSLAIGVTAVLSVPEGKQEVAYVIKKMSEAEVGLLPLYTASLYLWKAVWPFGLTPLYLAPGPALFLLCVLATVALSYAGWKLLRAGKPYVLLAWACYLLALIPTMAGLKAGIQPWADRYTYVPLVAVFILAAGAVHAAWTRRAANRAARLALPAGAALLLAALALLARGYTPVWKTSESLWRYTVAQDANTHSYNYLGLTYFNMGQLDSAEAYYARSIALEPGAITAIYNLGKVYEERKDDARAEMTYRKVLGYDSTHFGSNNNLGNVLLRRGEYAEALAAYGRAIASEPGYPYSYYNTAVAYERMGEGDKAVEWYVRAISVNPDYADAMVNLGVQLMNRGAMARAQGYFREALELKPDDPVALYNMGLLMERQWDYDKAAALYEAALRSRPDYYDALVNLGNVKFNNDKPEEAAVMFRKAMALQPDSADAYHGMGYVLYGSGMKDSAAALFAKAVQLKPGFAEAHFNYGVIQGEMGRKEAELEAFVTAARLGSEDAKKRLEKMGKSW